MLKKFAPERLKIFYFLRYIDSYKGMKSDQPIAEYAVGLFKLLARIPGLEGPPHSAAEVDDYLSKFATGVSSWKDVPDSWFHPLKHDSYTNDISRETSLFRDRAMFKVLVESVNRGERVFAVVGAGHVVMQERALRAVLR